MRLINTNTKSLCEFPPDEIPPYAILSHTWDVHYNEVTLEELNGVTDSSALTGPRFNKLNLSCAQALKYGLRYIWIDTCCIDKSSSAELSEAINSMYNWYRKAVVCFAYLSDVASRESVSHEDNKRDPWIEHFEKSRWFTRGWTLQELIAPHEIKFFGQGWCFLGSKRDLLWCLSRVTKIKMGYLSGGNLSSASVAEKLSWAAKRKTTRVEDEAYSLLGLLEVNMPLLYGEGRKAFQRLQEEFMKTSNDQSLFAWADESFSSKTDSWSSGLLAYHPCLFASTGRVKPDSDWKVPRPYFMTNMGVQISLYAKRTENKAKYDEQKWLLALIGCRNEDFPSTSLAIELEPMSSSGQLIQYRRTNLLPIHVSVESSKNKRPYKEVTLLINEFRPSPFRSIVSRAVFGFELQNFLPSVLHLILPLKILDAHPQWLWDSQRGAISIISPYSYFGLLTLPRPFVALRLGYRRPEASMPAQSNQTLVLLAHWDKDGLKEEAVMTTAHIEDNFQTLLESYKSLSSLIPEPELIYVNGKRLDVSLVHVYGAGRDIFIVQFELQDIGDTDLVTGHGIQSVHLNKPLDRE